MLLLRALLFALTVLTATAFPKTVAMPPKVPKGKGRARAAAPVAAAPAPMVVMAAGAVDPLRLVDKLDPTDLEGVVTVCASSLAQYKKTRPYWKRFIVTARWPEMADGPILLAADGTVNDHNIRPFFKWLEKLEVTRSVFLNAIKWMQNLLKTALLSPRKRY
jgi:hypothetical protein